MSDMKKRFELTIDHTMLTGAKMSFDTCLKIAVARAIKTGSMEGSATLKINFELGRVIDKETGEAGLVPMIKFKTSYAVPMKENFDGEICENSRIIPGTAEGEFLMVNDQICMEELLKGAGE